MNRPPMRRGLVLPLLYGLLAVCAPAFARQETAPAAPPPDLPARPYSLPRLETRTLPNGLKIVVAESHRIPMVTLRMAVQAGSVQEPQELPGLAAAVASQMTAGTARYTSLQLREAAENLGGAVSVSAGDDFATVSASALSEKAGALLALLADVLLHPTFPESELNIYKGLTLQQLVVQRQNPAFLANEQIAKRLYGAHAYGVVAPTPAAVNALTRDKLLAFYKAHYTPTGAVLIVVGDIQPAAVFQAVEKALGGWSGSGAAPSAPPAFPTPEARHLYLVNRPGSVQSNILLGNLALKRDDPDYYALALANAILGGSGFNSRLFANVREKQGFAYDARSALAPRALAGDITASAQTRTDVTAPALTEMLKEVERIRTEPVGEAELQAVKNFVNGTFVLSLDLQSGLADRLLTQEAYHLPADYLTTFRDKINAVTVADVQRVAQKYLHPDKAAIVVVGDAAKLRDSLKAICPLTEVQ
ncbi:MAG TPA: pitrilysin family protein [Chthonomonadaceae bacterium]|nr:pitrilysin family protein [Chthonomonadaceae bacterium]